MKPGKKLTVGVLPAFLRLLSMLVVACSGESGPGGSIRSAKAPDNKQVLVSAREQARFISFLTLLLLFLLILSAACSTGVTTPPGKTTTATSPTAQTLSLSPTATTSRLPAGTLLYKPDWSHGLAGWQGKGWKVVQGQLTTIDDHIWTIVTPYQPIVHNYAIEVQIQITKLFHRVGGYFSIFATKVPGHDGFQAGTSRFMEPGPRPNGSHPQAQILTDPLSSMGQGNGRPIDYEPLNNWHTYRIEVQDNEADFFIDGTQVSSTTSTVTPTLSTGPLGITCSEAILTVKNFQITAL